VEQGVHQVRGVLQVGWVQVELRVVEVDLEGRLGVSVQL
jgi:hypothetical protein